MLPKNKRIPLFFVLVFIYWFSLYVHQPIFTPYISTFSTTQMAGSIIASYGMMQMIFRIPMGMVSDKLKTRKYFITVGMLTSGLGALGLALCPTPGLAMFFRGMTGFAVSTWVPFSILYSSYYSHEQATQAIGIVNGVNFAGQMVGTLLGGTLADATKNVPGLELGQIAFYVAAGIAVVGAALSLFAIDQPKEDFPAKPVSFKELFKVALNKKLLIASGLAILTQMVAFGTVYGFTPTFAQHNVGASASQLSIMVTLVTLPAIFAAPLSAKIAKACGGASRSMAGAFLIMCAYCASVPFIKSITVYYIAQFVFGFARGAATSLLMGSAIQDISPDKRATAMGFFQAIYSIGMTIGPALVGWFGRSAGVGETNISGLTTGFMVIAAVQIIGSVLAWLLLPKNKPVQKSA